MAKQDGIIKLRGTVDDLTFARTKDGSQVRKKRLPVSALELQNSPKYARLRENMNEFQKAAVAGKLLRTAATEISANTTDKRIATRMTKAMMFVLNADTVNKRGQRSVVDGDVTLLKDFNFNPPSDLIQVLKAPVVAAIDRASGKLTANIPSFVPEDGILAAQGATHFMFYSLGLEVNFGTGAFIRKMFTSQGIPIGTDATPIVSIQHDMTANSTNPLFLMLGVRFFQEVNAVFYPLRNSASNALAIIEVSAAV